MSDEELRELLQELAALRAQRDELAEALRHTRTCLDAANEHGDINDTLWAGDCETLFDYIDAALAKLEVKP